MVTTRGRRASVLVEEPQLTPLRKKQRKEESHQGEANEHTISQVSDSKLRKKRPSTENPSSHSTNQSPKAKRQRKEALSTSPELRKSSRSNSPIVTRKQGAENRAEKEDASLQTGQEEISIPVEQALADEIKQESELEEGPANQLVPTSTPPQETLPEDPLDNFAVTEQPVVLSEIGIDQENSIHTGNNIASISGATDITQDQADLSHVQSPEYSYPTSRKPTPTPEETHAVTEASLQSTGTASAEDIIAQAAKAAEEALLGFSQSKAQNVSELQHHNSNGFVEPQKSDPPPTTPAQQDAQSGHIVTNTSQPYLQNHQRPQAQLQSGHYHPNIISSIFGPPPGQTQPTAVLYEKARQVANSKSSNIPRNKTPSVSQRRPWTLEEEQALMDGLDQVKGPHWSQILVLYGPGGSVNETLRDRTQVQLKDKARNLKLFFLKSKIEVPYYLSFVTGELKSRAPSHASTLDDTPPRPAMPSQNGQTNGNGIIATTARNRIPTTITTQPATNALLSPILQLPQPNSTYSSPYAPIGDVPSEFTSSANQDPSNDEDANQQDVADLATSAAAQVAAALANFSASDLIGLDLSDPMPAEIEMSDNTGNSKIAPLTSDHEAVEGAPKNPSEAEPEQQSDAKQYHSTIALSVLPESIKTFDTH